MGFLGCSSWESQHGPPGAEGILQGILWVIPQGIPQLIPEGGIPQGTPREDPQGDAPEDPIGASPRDPLHSGGVPQGIQGGILKVTISGEDAGAS